MAIKFGQKEMACQEPINQEVPNVFAQGIPNVDIKLKVLLKLQSNVPSIFGIFHIL